MRTHLFRAAFVGFLLCSFSFAQQPQEATKTPAAEVVELKFGINIISAAKLPDWFLGVEQKEGVFLPEEGGWRVGAENPFGAGRLVLMLDRAKINEDLALTLFYLQKKADLAIQLYDKDDKVVAVDLFANVVEINEEAKTDTAIVPLTRYPTANKIVIRRLKGEINVQGVVLFPVISEAATDQATLLQLSKMLGDPLSENNPLLAGFSNSEQSKAKVKAAEMEAAQRATPVARDSGIKVLQEGSEVSAANRDLVLLRITGKIDGSEEIHIDNQGATWVHKHWNDPTNVRLNDIAWTPATNRRLPNEGATCFLPRAVNFMSAKVLLAKGRDVCAMVPTKDKVIVFLCDSPNGASDYEVVIAFEQR